MHSHNAAPTPCMPSSPCPKQPASVSLWAKQRGQGPYGGSRPLQAVGQRRLASAFMEPVVKMMLCKPLGRATWSMCLLKQWSTIKLSEPLCRANWSRSPWNQSQPSSSASFWAEVTGQRMHTTRCVTGEPLFPTNARCGPPVIQTNTGVKASLKFSSESLHFTAIEDSVSNVRTTGTASDQRPHSFNASPIVHLSAFDCTHMSMTGNTWATVAQRELTI